MILHEKGLFFRHVKFFFLFSDQICRFSFPNYSLSETLKLKNTIYSLKWNALQDGNDVCIDFLFNNSDGEIIMMNKISIIVSKMIASLKYFIFLSILDIHKNAKHIMISISRSISCIYLFVVFFLWFSGVMKILSYII